MRLYLLALLIPLCGCATAPSEVDNFQRPPASIEYETDRQNLETASLNEEAVQQHPQFRRAEVDNPGIPEGTIVINTADHFLYLGLENGKAIRYGIGVGREGFRWKGTENVSAKKEWPSWTPPDAMIVRQPYLPRFMAGGPGNPLGARALYLGATQYRIHGTNDPTTIGKNVSSGCVRLTNEDVIDLYSRVPVGARVVVQ